VKPALDPTPTRTDLTSRDCASLLGGLLGSLVLVNGVEPVRAAMRFVANTDEVWDVVTARGPMELLSKGLALRARMRKLPDGVRHEHVEAISGLLGATVRMASGLGGNPVKGIRAARTAARWWTEMDEAWEPLQKAHDLRTQLDRGGS
jgi:hypothetical protein